MLVYFDNSRTSRSVIYVPSRSTINKNKSRVNYLRGVLSKMIFHGFIEKTTFVLFYDPVAAPRRFRRAYIYLCIISRVRYAAVRD